MEGKLIFERVPIFGEIKLNVKKESDKTYKYFNKEMNRLKQIDQLGILHKFLNIPPYRKYDYIITMLYLSERASKYSEKSDINFSNSVKLSNNVSFSSAEELIKCWCLLYSIGHLQETFTAEHALMKHILKEKDDFIEYVTKVLDLDMKDKINIRLCENIRSIINKEKFMEIYKIFTILKIKKNEKLTESDYYYKKFFELAKIMILKKDYLNFLEIERRKKLEKIIDYFEIIRKLTFTVLDGCISQNHLNFNYFSVFEDLESFMESNSYHELLNDINKFYTSDIFNSPESAYYHHRCVVEIEDEFKKYKLIELTDKLLKNDNDLEKEIVKKVEKLKESIDEKNKPVDADETNKPYINSELKDHFRININDLETPITQESQNFKQNQVFGGLLFNLSTDIYEIDIYPNSELTDKTGNEYKILTIIKNFYDTSSLLTTLLKTFHKLKILYGEVKKSGTTDFKKEIDSLNQKEKYLEFLDDDAIENLEINNFINANNKFRELCVYLFRNTLKATSNFSSWDLKDARIDFPIFFRKSDLNTIIKILKNAKGVKALELKNVLKQLENENEIESEDKNEIFYVLAPNTYFLKGKITITEIDFLLIKYQLSEKTKLLKIGEVKPNSYKFDADQCIKQLETIFDLPKSTATALYNGTIEDSKEYSVKNITKGDKFDNIIIFEKSEKLVYTDKAKDS